MKRRGWAGWLAAACVAGTLAAATQPAASEEPRRAYWVYLAEEPGGKRDAPLALSARAQARLARVGRIPGEDARDYAIPRQRLAPLLERGIGIRRLSRWLGAASAILTPEEVDALRRDPRVRAIAPVARFVRPLERAAPMEPSPVAPMGARSASHPARSRDVDPQSLTGPDYGAAWEQLDMLGVPELHERGYSGAGVLVALFDTGYRKDHASVVPLDLLAERDFVGGDGDVQYESGEPNDVPEINNHGTLTWSALGGYGPGLHLGPAYRASYVLARTEDVLREVHLEEDNYVAALEWADSLGVDLVSTSLGYRQFDGEEPYPIDRLDGRTLEITLHASEAADRGILVVTAMGNDGPAPETISAPADGERVVSVGAVDFFGYVVGFSSRGPTGDGRVKPDVSALGTFVACASAAGTNAYTRASGTSLSTPLAAGLAALLLEARPSWTPDSVLAALRASGDAAGTPDNARGWGVPDGLRALGLEQERLRIVSLRWEEEGTGADGVPAWGEQARLRLEVRNTGRAAASGWTARIGSCSAGVALLDSAAVELPTIPPGEAIVTQPVATALLGAGPDAATLGVFVLFEGGTFTVERRGYLSVPEGAPALATFLAPNPVHEAPVRISLHPGGAAAGPVTIADVCGRRIRRLDPAEALADGWAWDLKDDSGRAVASGIYLVLQKGRSGRICVLR